MSAPTTLRSPLRSALRTPRRAPRRRPALAAATLAALAAAGLAPPPAAASEIYCQIVWQFDATPAHADLFASASVLGSVSRYTFDSISVPQDPGTTTTNVYLPTDAVFDEEHADDPEDVQATAAMEAGMDGWPGNGDPDASWDFYAFVGDLHPTGYSTSANAHAAGPMTVLTTEAGFHMSSYPTVEYANSVIGREDRFAARLLSVGNASAALQFDNPITQASFTATIQPRLLVARDHVVDPAPPQAPMTESWRAVSDPIVYVAVYANGARVAYGGVGMNEWGDAFTVGDVSVNGNGDYVFAGDLADGLVGETEVELELASRGRLAGDLDDDGDIDAADVTALQALARNNYVVAGDFDPADLNCDDLVDKGHAANALSDVALLVRTILKTEFGDFNLDGAVNLADYNTLQAHFGGTNKTWAQGDANGDGSVNLADFNILQAHFGFTR